MRGVIGRYLGVAIFLLTLPAMAAAAPSEDPEALIRQGVELRRKGDDLRAEGYFRRAYELARTPRAAAQLGLVEMALGAFPDAEQYLSQALASSDAWVRANKAVLEQALVRVRAGMLRVELAGAPPGATITTPNRNSFKLAPDKNLWLPPGQTAMTVEADGFLAAEVKVSGAAGETRGVTVKMSPAAVGAGAVTPPTVAATPPLATPGEPEVALKQVVGAPDAPSPGRGLRLGGVAVAGAGVVSAVVGAVLFKQGSSKRDAIASPTHPYDPGDANWKTLQGTGIGLLVGGGVLLAGGVTMYLVGRQMDNAPAGSSSVSWSGAVGSGFAMLRCGGRF